MFRKFHERLKEHEEGFTLIELLVVILIIAILAAIAIPVFLNQRKKGWVSQSQSALKNAATAMESYATGQNPADYPDPGEEALLDAEGYNEVAGVTLAIVSSDGASEYCMSATHTQDIDIYYYDSNTGEPTTTACT